MASSIHPRYTRPMQGILLRLLAVLLSVVAHSSAQVDLEINREVWKQKYGVLNAQMNEQPPYLGWLAQDADGDGVKNRAEFIAGTNPFKKLPADPHFRPPRVIGNPSTLSLTFPTVAGKLYAVESSPDLVATWSRGALPSIVGNGGDQTLLVPKSAGKFFHLTVTDQASQGDLVSDWAKFLLGYPVGVPISSQTGFDHSSLAASLQQQNTLTLQAPDHSATQPPDGLTTANDFALIRIIRSGHQQIAPVTIPLAITGSAAAGLDYTTLPAAVTFPAGVNSLDLKITPLFNPNRTGSRTIFITAKAPESSGASGNYNLGNPSTAGVTIYPTNNAEGTGLTGNYYPGSSTTYTSPLNFGELVAATYSYTRTASSTTSGTVTITYNTSGNPATPFTIGNPVTLRFTSGNLNIAPFNGLAPYTINAVSPTASFTFPITGVALPNSSTGIVNLEGFASSITRPAPLIDYTWGHGTPSGTPYISADNYSVAWDGFLSPTVAGNYIFRLDADDRARLLIDYGTGNGFQQILENGWTSAATGGYKTSAPIALVAPATPDKRYPIRLEFVETTGSAKCKIQWQMAGGLFTEVSGASIWKDNISTTASAINNVWNANYYNNPNFTAPAARTQSDSEPTLGKGDWLTGSPDPSIFHNNFSSRWTGQILPQYSGTYYFIIKANQGAKLWINQQLIIDKWADATNETTATIDLQAGVLYDIKLEQYETTGASEVHLSWYSKDQARQIIPTNRLFPTSTDMPLLAGNKPAGEPVITSPTQLVVILGNGAVAIPLTSSNGGTISASGLPPWLSLIGGVLTGIPPSAGIYQFTITTTNATGSSSVVMMLEVKAVGHQLTRDLWTSGVTGPDLANVPWNAMPQTSDTVAVAEDNVTTYGTNTGERLRGYFIPPVTGNYYFWISASNAAELWISNDSEMMNKVRRASVTGPAGTAARTWNSQPNQKSHWLSLVGGERYYIEALHNTGSSGSGNHLSVAWFLDPTGNTANPLADGTGPAAPALGGVISDRFISPWDYPPTTSVPGTLYVTNLQGASGLSNITGTGSSFLRVNGSTAVLQLNESGLTSGVISRKLHNLTAQPIFDLGSQDKNYPGLRTSDGGYTWNMQSTDLLALNRGEVRLVISTINHPNGELTGVFGKTAGSQMTPAVPPYPAWPDDHTTSDAANSRFLTQATFGPSPSDMIEIKANGYRTWMENQLDPTLSPPTLTTPYVVTHLSNDPQNPYPSTLFFDSWWQNAVTAPDQLRQRAAFALSEILVVSDTGPLNNNGRALADYYDTLIDSAFGNFRDILKQVTLSPAMGVYLDMRANYAGSIITGVHPNENYAREILQLFSAGLYRIWPDGTLALNSQGNAVPTYDQSVVTGMARVFTGWNWGQPLNGGRLPVGNPSNSNYMDPMILIASKHELGTKLLLDNVMLPAATVTSASTTATETSPIYTVQARATASSNLIGTDVTNAYDRNGLRDLEVTLDNIINNAATGPYICRQLIQRLVTSHPKPEYLHRVVRAFNGEQNVDGIRTGVRGDMKDVFRAILLDYEARTTTAAADPQFGKQREPLLRLTAPARSFPAAAFPGSSYRQIGHLPMLVTTPIPHRLINGETIALNTLVDSDADPTKLPTAQSYTTKNTTPAYSLNGPTGIATITAPGHQAGDLVALQFTTGTLGTTAPFNSVQNYTVLSATPLNFTINIGVTTFAGTITGNSHTPYQFTVDLTSLSSPNYTSVGNSVTVSSSGYLATQKVYLKFSTGGLSGSGFDGLYTIATATTSNFTVTLPSSPTGTSGVVLIPKLSGGYDVSTSGGVSSIAIQTSANHNLNIGDSVQLRFLVTNSPIPAQSLVYQVQSISGPNVFSIDSPSVITAGSQGSGGMVAYPLFMPASNRMGTATVGLSTWNLGYTQDPLNQTPLNSTTVFNFFYPDFQYPGEIAQAGMTTPEFQLTNDSNTMVLTNAISTSILSASNTNGYTSFKNGSGALTIDLGPYMTPAQTGNTGIPALVDQLGILLTGGNLSSGARTAIINYVANNTNFPFTTPTNTQLRDRVRAVVHLILTSAEFAIQK